MLSFVNKKFAFMERKMRIGLNYLTDQVEYIFKPDNITRIERVLNGKGTVVDYNYIFKLTGVSQICLTVGKPLDGGTPSKLESIYEENMFSSLEYIFLLGFGVIVSSLIILLIYKLKKK
jgi:hypothetical protein